MGGRPPRCRWGKQLHQKDNPPPPRDNTALALASMTATAALFGVTPLAIAATHPVNPMLLSATIRTGIALAALAALMTLHCRRLRDPKLLVLIMRRMPCRENLAIQLSYLDYVILPLALNWAQPAAAAMAYEVWPVIIILIVARWTQPQHRSVPAAASPLLALALLGVILVTLSQRQDPGVPVHHLHTAAGIALALLAGAATALTGFSWVWCHNTLSDSRVPRDLVQQTQDPDLRMFVLLAGLAVANIIAALLAAMLGITLQHLTHQGITTAQALTGLAGGLATGMASILWRFATTRTRNITIHAVGHATPAFSLAFLALSGQAGQVHPAPLAAGTACIVAANLLLAFGVHQPRHLLQTALRRARRPTRTTRPRA